MNENFEKTAEQAAAFQKIWADSMTKMMQAAFSMTPNSAPPEVLRQIRSGLFQALAQSWDEFMRSPQFLEGMKQWMDSAINFRKVTNDFMARVRNELQAPSREDIDAVMLGVRHMEKRLLDQIEDLAHQVSVLNQRLPNGGPHAAAKKAARPRANKNLRRPAPGNGKVKTP
jgi:uncharacterized protein (DUF2267 family)